MKLTNFFECRKEPPPIEIYMTVAQQFNEMVVQQLLEDFRESRLIADEWAAGAFEPLQDFADTSALPISTLLHLSDRQSSTSQFIGPVADPILSPAPAGPPRIVPYPR
jgi:hypothetical protein